jgi:transcriptional regulator with XRE-family HTH domain
MDNDAPPFGVEMRRQRIRAGLSLGELARQVHYSKSHLSKVETGAKAPSRGLATRCDATLSCSGSLARLMPLPGSDIEPPVSRDTGQTWVLKLDADGRSQFESVFDQTTAPPRSTSHRIPVRASERAGADEVMLASFRAMFDQARALGQRASAAVLLPILVTQTYSLRMIARQAVPGQRAPALMLAARFAEYTGWMAQESGDDAIAAWWTEQAVALAAAGGDDDMAAYALVRRALITLYRNDSVATVALARAAQAVPCHPRIRGLAAQREAQGHAVGGNYDNCLRALDRARDLLSDSADQDAVARSGDPVIGTSHLADPVAVATGWCLFDLGEPSRAVELLHGELERIPEHATRARTRYGARLALALADSGEIDEACAVVEPVLDCYAQLDSATIRVDLRRLAEMLNRRRTHPGARDTWRRLSEALHEGPA